MKGGADKSYGIQVAKLAGVPEPVLQRAYEIANQLAEHDINASSIIKEDTKPIATKSTPSKKKEEVSGQLSLFSDIDCSEIIEELKNIDISRITPIEALNKLYVLQEKVK